MQRYKCSRLGARGTGDLVERHPFQRGAITGIIDWTDAAIADPARDFALIYPDLGPDALAAMPVRYQRPLRDDGRERILLLARSPLIEDIAYGLNGGDPI